MSDEIKNKAYLEGLKLKNTGLDEELIGIRLIKQGFTEELAKQVAKDIMIERQRDVADSKQPYFYFALLKIGVGVLAAVAFAIAVPGQIFIPVGFIGGGFVYALVTWPRKRK